MGSRRPRTKPTATELGRVQKLLEAQPAFRSNLGPGVPVEKRTGQIVTFSSGAYEVAQAMIGMKLKPERAHLRLVLRVATEVLSIPRGGGMDL